MQSEMPLITDRSPRHTLSVQPIHRHKPGCPKYIPSSESHLLSNIDSIKKMSVLHPLITPVTLISLFRILPDIPEMADPSDNQPYIHFYIPSTNERLTIQKNASSKWKTTHSSDDFDVYLHDVCFFLKNKKLLYHVSTRE